MGTAAVAGLPSYPEPLAMQLQVPRFLNSALKLLPKSNTEAHCPLPTIVNGGKNRRVREHIELS